MITSLISFQIVKFIIGGLILILFTFLIFAGLLIFKSHDFENIFTKEQKEQLDYIVDTYYLIYIIDTKLDDKSKEKVEHDIFQVQNYLMEMARIVGSCAGKVYVKTKIEIMCKSNSNE